jgi:membrane fusion protein (multidrug efflux system)
MSNGEKTQNEQGSNNENPQPGENSERKPKKKKGAIWGVRYKTIGIVVLAIIIIVGAYFGVTEFLYYQNHVTTNDAMTNGHINPVLSRVSGYVERVYVDDNEHVKKGQLLVQIDTTDFALKVAMAKAALLNARASLGVAQAGIQSAQVNLNKAQTDYHRIKTLYKGGATTKSKYQDIQAELASAKAKVKTAKKHAAVDKSQIQSRKDNLKNARLQLSYTTIRARSDGVISKKNIREGQYITAGQPVMALTDVQNVWVTANFKETGLHDIRVGQNVKIHIDAYPDKSFKGRVQSIAGATGASFSLLPPENATGNYVKVVQRVPVKIVFTQEPDPRYPLRIGLNVEASIDLNQKIDSSNNNSRAEAGK